MNFQYGTESLNYYFKQGKLTQSEYTTVQEAMKNLYNIINNSVKNYNRLHNVSNVLRKEVNTAKYDLEAATCRQSEASDTAEKLSRLLKTAEVAFESQKTSYDNLVFESDELEKDILNRNLKIKEEMREAEERMEPRRERYQNEIVETKASNEKARQQIETLQQVLEQNMGKVNALKVKNEEADTELKRLGELKLKIVDSPEHYLKSAENLHIEIVGMENELKETH